MPCAASPPSTFCQEKVTTSSLAQSRSWAKQALVASQIVSALAVGGDEVAVRHAHARGGAVPGEHQVGVAGAPWSGPAAGRRARRAPRPSSFSCLTTSVTQSLPKLSKASSCTGRGPEHRPQRHLDGAGVGAGHDADQVVGRDLQHLAGLVDGVLAGAPCRAWSGASGRGPRLCRFSGVHPGRLAQGPDENSGRAGRMAGLAGVCHSDVSHPCRWAAPRWEGVARRAKAPVRASAQAGNSQRRGGRASGDGPPARRPRGQRRPGGGSPAPCR